MTGHRKPRPGQSLADKFPDIAKQWHPTRNADLTPAQIMPASNTKAWWRCRDGHEWEATVAGRTSSRGSGCPVHAGRQVVIGLNDLATRFPDIAAQWHPTRNGDLRADQVSVTTGQKVWWECPTGHVYQAGVAARVRGAGCPLCPATSETKPAT